MSITTFCRLLVASVKSDCMVEIKSPDFIEGQRRALCSHRFRIEDFIPETGYSDGFTIRN